MGIFEEFIAQVDEDLTCGICHGVLERPLICCNEGHSYCESCLESWNRRSHTCPECRRPSISLNLQQPVRNLGLERMIARLMVKCGRLCEWNGRYDGLALHRANECLQRVIPCRSSCGWIGRFVDEEAHLLNQCSKFEKECHNGCGAAFSLAAGEVSADVHYREVCPLQEVQCCFAKYGCEMRPKRQDMADHHSQFAVQHEQFCHAMVEKVKEENRDKTRRLCQREEELRLRDHRIRSLEAHLVTMRTTSTATAPSSSSSVFQAALSAVPPSSSSSSAAPSSSSTMATVGRRNISGQAPGNNSLSQEPAEPPRALITNSAFTPTAINVLERQSRALVHTRRVNGWNVGDYVEVRDLNDDLWYPGLVTYVCPARNIVKIHFLGWNSLWFDEEISLDSGRLRRPVGERPSDWRFELAVNDQVEILHADERQWLLGDITMVNRGTGHIYVRCRTSPALSRWVHSYSDQLRLPLGGGANEAGNAATNGQTARSNAETTTASTATSDEGGAETATASSSSTTTGNPQQVQTMTATRRGGNAHTPSTGGIPMTEGNGDDNASSSAEDGHVEERSLALTPYQGPLSSPNERSWSSIPYLPSSRGLSDESVTHLVPLNRSNDGVASSADTGPPAGSLVPSYALPSSVGLPMPPQPHHSAYGHPPPPQPQPSMLGLSDVLVPTPPSQYAHPGHYYYTTTSQSPRQVSSETDSMVTE